MHTTDEPSNPGPRALLPWLFPLALWALATLALGGDLGRYFDDYATTMRDPVTGGVNLGAPFEHFPFFWRPLHWLYVFHSLTWFHDCLWIPHVLTALSHGLASILLYTLLRRLLRSPHAAAAAALLFAVYPMNYEVTIWIASTTNSMATSIWFLLAHLYISYLRGRAGLWAPLAMAPLAFAIPCLNEQASAGILALPVLGLFLPHRATPLPRRVLLAAWPAAAASLMVLLYIVLLRATAPPGWRGAAGSYLSPGDLLPRLQWVAHELGVVHYQWRLMASLRHGWPAGLEALPVLSWISWTAILAVAFVPWLSRWRRTPLRAPVDDDADTDTADDDPPNFPPSPLAVLLFGLALFVAAWLPLVVVIGQIAESRMGYFPAVGAAIALAALIDLAAAGAVRARLEPLFKPALALAVALAAWFGAVCLVGHHRAFQDQARADLAQSARLRELVPEPPPGAVFVPLSVAAPQTGAPARLRPAVVGWLWVRHGATPLIKETYRRADLRATIFNPWFPLPIKDADAEGFTYTAEGQAEWIRWEDAIPFIIDADEQVHLVGTIQLEQVGIVVRPPIVARAACAADTPATTWTFQAP